MLIQIESDWHLELHRDNGRNLIAALDPAGVDVLVLAGDIISGQRMHLIEYVFNLLTLKYANAHIVYVPGNHEFWNGEPESVWARLKEVEAQHPAQLHFLRNEVFPIDGRKILGGTMWFPKRTLGREMLMPDFELIAGFCPWVYDEHRRFVNMLEKNLGEGDIVLTHHMPSPMSIAPRFQQSRVTEFFVANQEEHILARKPALWVHGHTHDTFDYTLGSTRVICNPYGYPRENCHDKPNRTLVEV